MKCMSKAAVIALASVIVIASGALCGYAQNKPLRELDKKMEKAKTPEKREAIAHIRDLFREYDRHYLAMNIVDYILDADRNIPILAKLAEYAITEGSNTMTYIEIAEQAAKAPLADKEFLQLAELAKKTGGGYIDLAKEAARAKTDAELQAIRTKIATLESQKPGVNVSDIYSPNPMRQLDRKLKIAQTDEKREAIASIRDLFKKYNRHYMAMDIVDFILEADRNVPTLAKLAEYAIGQGSSTVLYIAIAEQASEAPRADREFLRLAELVKDQKGGMNVVALARQAAQANTDAELKEVQEKIAALK